MNSMMRAAAFEAFEVVCALDDQLARVHAQALSHFFRPAEGPALTRAWFAAVLANEQAVIWGSILPAVWSMMLAARLSGVGTAWTTVHLSYEQEAAEVLGIPFEQVTQAALLPMGYTVGATFKPASRLPLEAVVHWEQW